MEITVKFSKEEEVVLKYYAQKKSLQVADYVREVVLENLEDAMDVEVADLVLKDIEEGKDIPISFEEFEKRWKNNEL